MEQIRNISGRFTAIFAAALLCGLCGTTGAEAAANGALGLSSSAQTTVSLTIPELVRASGAEDISLGAYGGSGALSGGADLCVYSNGSGNYQVRVTSNTGGGFGIRNAEGATLPMNVSWNNAAAASGAQQLSHGTPVAMTAADTTDPDCSSGGKNANISVHISQETLSAAGPGQYAGTLAIMIEPN